MNKIDDRDGQDKILPKYAIGNMTTTKITCIIKHLSTNCIYTESKAQHCVLACAKTMVLFHFYTITVLLQIFTH